MARLWRFARGETSTADFERWLYATPELESLLGPQLYLPLIAEDYRDVGGVHDLRRALPALLDAIDPRACECLTWRDNERVPLGYETRPEIFLGQLDVLRERTPWLDAVRCRACGQAWYLAVDTRDDDYYLQRLSEDELTAALDRDEWPSTFDGLEAVWP
jgi:hypothetical protein